MPLRLPWIIRCLWIAGQPSQLEGQQSVVAKSLAFEFKKPRMALRHFTYFWESNLYPTFLRLNPHFLKK